MTVFSNFNAIIFLSVVELVMTPSFKLFRFLILILVFTVRVLTISYIQAENSHGLVIFTCNCDENIRKKIIYSPCSQIEMITQNRDDFFFQKVITPNRDAPNWDDFFFKKLTIFSKKVTIFS